MVLFLGASPKMSGKKMKHSFAFAAAAVVVDDDDDDYDDGGGVCPPGG